MPKSFLLIFINLFVAVSSNAQLVVWESSPESLALALMPDGITIYDVSYQGNSSSIGYYTANNTNIALNTGVIMSTGYIYTAIGPNNKKDTGTDLFRPGPLPPIPSWSGIHSINGVFNDAAVLRFAFTSPIETDLSFRYVFASEEYNEFVNTQYNDFLGIYIVKTSDQTRQNLATLQNGNPISISSINNGYSSGCSTGGSNPSNPSQFIDNCYGLTVQYDGITKPLQKTVNIEANEEYTMWFVISDVGDGIFDSGVFIEGNNTYASVTEADVNSYAIYPNPSNGNFSISGLEADTKLLLTNLSGQLIWAENTSGQSTINVTLDIIPNGIYFLSLYSQGKSSTQKIIVNR